jgi:Putative zinc-binding metallo-peptidase
MSRRRPDWERLPAQRLQGRRIAGLGLSLRRGPVTRAVRQLQRELGERGLALRPHCWVAFEWFSPDGIPGIAIPFYLLHPRLRALQQRAAGEVEGGDARELMRILRHEAGHAIDNAFRLRRRAGWRKVFGHASRRYSATYLPRPGSRRYVQHLGGWYSQSHPTEDFAETFAVWLAPRSDWRSRYAGWPQALAKLRYVDRLMRELRGRPAQVRSRRVVEPVRDSTLTLGQYFGRVARRSRCTSAPRIDAALRKLFAPPLPGRQRLAGADFLRKELPRLRRRVARQLGVSQYLVQEVAKRMIARSSALGLRLRGSQREARPRLERLVAQEVARATRQRGPRHSI